MTKVFFSYSHVDEALRDQLEIQLKMLKRQGIIETWHDRRIVAGQELDGVINEELMSADIVLLLVSPDFLASEYCYDREMTAAMQRHDQGEAVVIPVILRPCDWFPAPFGKLTATPSDAKPVTQWPDRDVAMLDVVKDIRKAAERFSKVESSSPRPPDRFTASVSVSAIATRSSNLGLAKSFTDRDKDKFRVEAFDYLAKYFENSLTELAKRNEGVDGDFRRIDSNRFTAAVYRGGKAVSRCTIFMGGGFSSTGINYADGETSSSNSMNESLTVHSDDQSMFLRSMGMQSYGRDRDEHLTMEGAAEAYWSLFIQRLQSERY